MSAKEKDLEIEDDLARGMFDQATLPQSTGAEHYSSAENPAGLQSEDLKSIEEELCT